MVYVDDDGVRRRHLEGQAMMVYVDDDGVRRRHLTLAIVGPVLNLIVILVMARRRPRWRKAG